MSQTPVPVEPESAPPSELSSARRLPRAAWRRNARWLLPIGVLAGSSLLIAGLFASAPEPERIRWEAPIPSVQGVTVEAQPFLLTVVAHGTVEPRTESDLVAEVRGRVIRVAPALEAGGFFEAGDELLRLDGREYQISLERSRAAVKLAQSENELAAAEVRRRRLLVERGVASNANLEQFESRALVAVATLDQARANLAQAELDLERTVVRAPFDGRVRERSVDLGQFVSPGSLLARVYGVDHAEVRLPIRTDELSFLEIPLGYAAEEDGATVTLHASLGGQDLEWPARLVRTEGEIDLRTRMMNVIARVDDPHGRTTEGRVPLPAGLFVRAEIEGRLLDGVFVLPTPARRDGDQMYVVEDNRLVFRDVEIVRRGRDAIIVSGGLADGDVVVVSPLHAATDGMSVHLEAGDSQ